MWGRVRGGLTDNCVAAVLRSESNRDPVSGLLCLYCPSKPYAIPHAARPNAQTLKHVIENPDELVM